MHISCLSHFGDFFMMLSRHFIVRFFNSSRPQTFVGIVFARLRAVQGIDPVFFAISQARYDTLGLYDALGLELDFVIAQVLFFVLQDQ